MKRLLFAAFFAVFAAGVFAFDFNLDARSDFTYTSFMMNSAYDAMAQAETASAFSTYEEIRVKAKDTIGQVKFDFDARAYLYPQTESVTYTVDSACFSYAQGQFVLTAGKQRMKWGTAYFFNPTDRLQPAVNILNPTEDLEGIYALRGELTTDFCTPLVVIMPRLNGSQPDSAFDAAARVYKLIGTCDVYLDYIYRPDGDSAGAAFSWDTGFFVVNFEAALDADPPEGAETIQLGGRPYSTAMTLGVMKMVSQDTSIFAEYYRNGGGFGSAAYSNLVNTSGIGPFLSKKDYIAYSGSYTWNETYQFSLTGIHGLDDGTIFMYPSIGWVGNQNFDVSLYFLQNLTAGGTREGNYSTPFYSETELRINAYF
jgi:hypothetical protein